VRLREPVLDPGLQARQPLGNSANPAQPHIFVIAPHEPIRFGRTLVQPIDPQQLDGTATAICGKTFAAWRIRDCAVSPIQIAIDDECTCRKCVDRYRRYVSETDRGEIAS
jgi:hypothetical protein